MSQENVETLRARYEAISKANVGAAFDDIQGARKPSKPWGCRSKTLTPTPEPCGILTAAHRHVPRSLPTLG
jgi:hypothetical protein